MEYEFFVTDRCNADCPYCFVNKGTYTMSMGNAVQGVRYACEGNDKNIPITIWGGEPTLAPDITRYIIEELNAKGMKNICLYSNGSDIDFLEKMKSEGVHVIINMDAYDSLKIFGEEDIFQFDWNFTIAPSNLDRVLYWYYQFLMAGKYPDFKLARYWRNGSDYWTHENIPKLKECLTELYGEYAYILEVDKKSYMPYILKDTIIRLLCLDMNMMMNDCSGKREIRNGEVDSCYFYKMCSHEHDIFCGHCDLNRICLFSKPCYERIVKNDAMLCEIFNILCTESHNISERLNGNPIWERAVASIYEDIFNGKR